MLRLSHLTTALLALTLAAPAPAAPPLQARSATFQCADTRVTVDAACYPYAGTTMMCTRQAVRFTGADGKTLGTRTFKPEHVDGEDVPVVTEQFGALACVDTKAGERFVVATMDNGGNCAQCEWVDVYAPDGKLVGSTRGGKKAGAPLDAAIGAAYGKAGGRLLGRQDLASLYVASAARPAPPAAAAFACPVKEIAAPRYEQKTFDTVADALTRAFEDTLGPDARRLYERKVMARVAASRVDEAKMATLAEVSGCASLLDVQSSCAQFYDPELGNPLSVFMGMKPSAPLRRQFEAAIAHLPDGAQKRAAQACIKLVGKH
jgi:hypothetical protein